ncbi:MAG: hypothetical protein MUE33_08055 [Cytophagaceae bacterium]|jgi:Spy/CpxP family protein refolding chaperone|nr:hypothetical protein [Cytophagaceae bacterium]
MKKCIVFIALSLSSVFVFAQSNGQGNGSSKNSKGKPQAATKAKVGNGNGQVNSTKPKNDPASRAQNVTKVMDSVVTLTPEQKTKVQDIQMRRIQEMQTIKAKYNGDMQAAKPELQAAKQKYKTELSQVLTAEQAQKWEAYKQVKKQEMMKKRNDMQKGKPATDTAPTPTEAEQQLMENLELED